MPKLTCSLSKWAFAAVAFGLTGCSVHPIPDDVSRYDTADIVRNIRCEARQAVWDRVKEALLKRGITDIEPEQVLANKAAFAKIKRRDPRLAAKFKAYAISTISYDFFFNITETNNKNGNLNFAMPIVPEGKFTLLLDGQIDRQRIGKRQFRTVEKFEDLARDPAKCGHWVQPESSIIYPMTGSIGVGRIINTFIEVSEMGAQDADQLPKDEKVFKDVIKFTTTIGGTVTPTLRLNEVPDRFRLTNATFTKTNSRVDLHQVTISLLFPDLDEVREAVFTRAVPLPALEEDLERRSLENNCVSTERAREDRFGTLRRVPPEIYCRGLLGDGLVRLRNDR